jgi:hypothetical protein
VAGHRPNLQAAAGQSANALQVRDLAQPDHVPRLHQALLQQQHECRAARHQVRVLAVRVQELERLLQRAGSVIVK